MKSILLAVFLAFSYLTLGGCATIINGTTQKIPVNTAPQGATAKNQDGVSCITPGSLYRLTPDSISLELKPVIAELEKPGLFIDKFKELEDLENSDTITE